MNPLRLISGLLLASLLAQFPTFSDQYLAGLIDHSAALTEEVGAAGQAIRTANATPDPMIEDARRERLRMAQARLEHARTDIQALTGASPIRRILLLDHFGHPQLLRQTWLDFTPKLPVSGSGLLLALPGFGLGWLLALLAGLPFRKRRPSRR